MKNDLPPQWQWGRRWNWSQEQGLYSKNITSVAHSPQMLVSWILVQVVSSPIVCLASVPVTPMGLLGAWDRLDWR
jgi:hypothetical protein